MVFAQSKFLFHHEAVDIVTTQSNRLTGLVVKASAWRVKDLGFKSHLRWDFSRSSHTSDLKKIGTLVATLPGACAGTGQPGVSIL